LRRATILFWRTRELGPRWLDHREGTAFFLGRRPERRRDPDSEVGLKAIHGGIPRVAGVVGDPTEPAHRLRQCGIYAVICSSARRSFWMPTCSRGSTGSRLARGHKDLGDSGRPRELPRIPRHRTGSALSGCRSQRPWATVAGRSVDRKPAKPVGVPVRMSADRWPSSSTRVPSWPLPISRT